MFTALTSTDIRDKLMSWHSYLAYRIDTRGPMHAYSDKQWTCRMLVKPI